MAFIVILDECMVYVVYIVNYTMYNLFSKINNKFVYLYKYIYVFMRICVFYMNIIILIDVIDFDSTANYRIR